MSCCLVDEPVADWAIEHTRRMEARSLVLSGTQAGHQVPVAIRFIAG